MYRLVLSSKEIVMLKTIIKTIFATSLVGMMAVANAEPQNQGNGNQGFNSGKNSFSNQEGKNGDNGNRKFGNQGDGNTGFGNRGFGDRGGDIPSVPEPSTYGMMFAGLGLVIYMVRRKKNS
jgi:hypothetical protein